MNTNWEKLGYVNAPIEKSVDLKSEIRRLCKEKNAIII